MFEIRPIERPVGVFINIDATGNHQRDDFPQTSPENTPFIDVAKAEAGQGSLV